MPNYFKCIVGALDVCSASTSDDLRLLMDGEIRELGHESRNMQVVVKEPKGDSKLTLVDHEGAFMTIEPTEHVTKYSSDEQGRQTRLLPDQS